MPTDPILIGTSLFWPAFARPLTRSLLISFLHYLSHSLLVFLLHSVCYSLRCTPYSEALQLGVVLMDPQLHAKGTF